jgi:membrane protein CcdC involved in cytochrome C biogenesis
LEPLEALRVYPYHSRNLSIGILAGEKWLLAFAVVVPNMRFPVGFYPTKEMRKWQQYLAVF